jgi:hypothetical protein
MAQWQASFTRAPTQTKAELRQMLAEAVRNTQPGTAEAAKPAPKAKKSTRVRASAD